MSGWAQFNMLISWMGLVGARRFEPRGWRHKRDSLTAHLFGVAERLLGVICCSIPWERASCLRFRIGKAACFTKIYYFVPLSAHMSMFDLVYRLVPGFH
jgi:hypothetical protein